MRLRERDKRDVMVYRWTGMHEDVHTWGEAFAIRAAVYPLGETVTPGVYGEREQDMRRMLYDGKETLLAGMGVSLDGGTPAFRITAVRAYSHVDALLERIPEGRRG